MIIHFITLLTVSVDSLAEVVGGWSRTVRSLGEYNCTVSHHFLSTKLNLDTVTESAKFLLQDNSLQLHSSHNRTFFRHLEFGIVFFVFYFFRRYGVAALLLAAALFNLLRAGIFYTWAS
jgi:hypothetical protein